jgi:cation-transporting ATPase V
VSQQTRDHADATPTTEMELAVSGMTCGSCAARVQKVLGRQEGVEEAAVNFATGRATVVFDPTLVPVDDLVEAVGKIGYGLSPAQASPEGETADGELALQAVWLRRVLVAWPLGIAVLVLSMVFMHEPWARWSALALTVPVQFWAGWPFLHQAALRARAGQANMDTLITIGTLSAFTFSTAHIPTTTSTLRH